MSRARHAWHLLLLGSCCLRVVTQANAASPAPARTTFSVDYIVEISATDPKRAHIRWELSGADEITSLHLKVPADGRLSNVEGSGSVVLAHEIEWTLRGPFNHLSYDVAIDHRRGGKGRFDSFSGDGWIVTRARDLFPRTSIRTRDGTAARARGRLIFRTPAGWETESSLPRLGPNVFGIDAGAHILAKPSGWFILGNFASAHQEIAGLMIRIARAAGTGIDPATLFRFLERALPPLQHLLSAEPQSVLIVSAPDPLWHGGLSARGSFFMHASRPLRTPDHTSPFLHELFHVLQTFRFAADADWLTEGLAEYYSIELQRRTGLVSEGDFKRALGLFVKYGAWNLDLTQQKDGAATNNSAPAVLYALDQRIQRATSGQLRLDDVVRRLVAEPGKINTATFERVVEDVSGRRFRSFFQRHVHSGIAPSLTSTEER